MIGRRRSLACVTGGFFINRNSNNAIGTAQAEDLRLRVGSFFRIFIYNYGFFFMNFVAKFTASLQRPRARRSDIGMRAATERVERNPRTP